MLFASLIPFALLALSGAVQPAEAAFIEGACSKGQYHCVYTPPASQTVGKSRVELTQGKLIGVKYDKAGGAIWQTPASSLYHVYVQCKKSPKPESWYIFNEKFTKDGVVCEIDSAADNSGVANAMFQGEKRVEKGATAQTKVAGADVVIQCPK